MVDIAGKYVAMGNLYIHEHLEAIPGQVRAGMSVCLMLGVVLLARWQPCPGSELLILERSLVALGSAGFGSQLLGRLKVGKHHLTGISFLSLFVLVFFSSFTLKGLDRCNEGMLRGRVLLGGQPLKEAIVHFPNQDLKDRTTMGGHFDLHLSRPLDTDSLSLRVQYKRIDTLINLKEIGAEQESGSLVILLPDTLPLLTRAIAKRELEKQIPLYPTPAFHPFHGNECNLDCILDCYKPYDQIPKKHRNNWYMVYPNGKLEFQKRLLAHGIREAKQLEPYSAHQFTDFTAIMIECVHEEDVRYLLEYAFINNRQVTFTNVSVMPGSGNQRIVTGDCNENIRAVHVRLKWPFQDTLKIRTMTFYGFLPTDDYVFHFKEGKWQLQYRYH